MEKVGNYKIETPGLFRGRGTHPKTGRIKKRIVPEDVIINIGEDCPLPKCPILGHAWGGVTHDNTVSYLAKWVENLNGSHKFVYLHSSSRFKGQADREKYEKARELKSKILQIRHDYTRKLSSSCKKIRQLATAVWMIDILAIRIGNEKDVEETADTVGVCSLRVEHIKLLPMSSEVILDFLGKDSMRYYNKVKFPNLVFQNIQIFMLNKKIHNDLLDRIDPNLVNSYLKKFMDGLSAKVFRTFNASFTLQKELNKKLESSKIFNVTPKSTLEDKIFFYNQANKQVAILCNHQRSIPKSFNEQIIKIDVKVKEKGNQLKQLKRKLKWTNKKKDLKIKSNMVSKKIKIVREKIYRLKLNQALKQENREIALGTSKINYMDPRITISFAKRFELPIEKIFNKSLIEKFPWACSEGPDFLW